MSEMTKRLLLIFFMIFLNISVQRDGFPFLIKKTSYSQEFISSVEEARRLSRDPNVKAYTDLDQLFADLYAEEDQIIVAT
jgi:DNA-damage-inducible protein J